MASSSAGGGAGADVIPRPIYDVFISFRGVDTRLKFTSHLYAGLERKKIYTYMDDKLLERGDEIGPALLTAIEHSKISIIIFSKHYASSSWCLDELVHILKCKEAYGQLVVPVFYDIDPSHVRWQLASYADSFKKLEERFKNNLETVCGWRKALKTAASLSGDHSQSENIRHEHELVETIVEDILKKLNRSSSYTVKGLVGMESHIQQIELLLCINSQDVCLRTIGIWGMGGIGKTTLADAVFHRNKTEFYVCVFLANVREQTEKHGSIHLRNELLCKLLKEEHLSIDSPSIGLSYVLDRLSRTKVLLVLDDVSNVSQLDYLLGDQIQFGHGSRIILTSRNKRLFKKRVHEDHIYKMNELHVNEALQLFQSIAFEDGSSTTDYSDLCVRVVDHSGCNPLALKVLAFSFIHCNSKEDWEKELKRLKKFPNKMVQNVLRLSYDRLEENEQRIFLDIACFLKGKTVCDAKRMLEILGLSASCGIRILIDMSLIFISVDNRLEMHDLLQEMGKTIESGIEELGKRKRLWNSEDSYQVLLNETGTSSVEALVLDMSKIPELQLSPTAFKNMYNLKLLKLYAPQNLHYDWKRKRSFLSVEEKKLWSLRSLPGLKAIRSFLAKFGIQASGSFCNHKYELFKKYCKVYFPGGLEILPQQLRYLYWDGYPWKSLPSKFSPVNLVELHMPYSQVRQLWSDVQNLGSLKVLNLSHSLHLVEVPDLSRSPNIEKVDLSYCTSLVEIPPYFKNLEKLTSLDLTDSKNVTTLGEIPCNLEKLYLSGSGIEEISSSIWCHEKLHALNVGRFHNLKSLPSSNIFKVGDQNQRYLLSRLSFVEKLDHQLTNGFIPLPMIRWPCSSVLKRFLFLKDLNLSLICLSPLQVIDLRYTMIESVPSSIINAHGLCHLSLLGCKRLQVIPELPWQLETLNAQGCTSLKSVASSRNALLRSWELHKSADGYCDKIFEFGGCLGLDKSSRSNILSDAELRIMQIASASSCKHAWRRRGFYVTCPGNEIPAWFRYKSEGSSVSIKYAGSTQDHCLAGFALSAVIAWSECTCPSDDDWHALKCEYKFQTKDGKVHELDYVSYGVGAREFDGNHVSAFFDNKHFGFKDDSLKCNPDEITEASFHFYPQSYHPHVCEEGSRMKVKKCGVHVLYDEALRNQK